MKTFKRIGIALTVGLALLVTVKASKDSAITVDPETARTRSLRCKQVVINATMGDDGAVTYTFEVVRERVILTQLQSGGVRVERMGYEVFNPDFAAVQAFVAATMPTGLKAVRFWEAFSDAQP